MGEDRSPAAVFGLALKAERNRRGLSLADVSHRLEGIGAGASPPYLSRVERGQRGVSLDVALAIARALDVPLVDLLAVDDVQVGHDTLAADAVRNLVSGGPLPVETQTLVDYITSSVLDRTILAMADAAQRPSDLLQYLHDVRQHGLPDRDESEQ